MLVHIVRFYQRYALFCIYLVGLFAHRLILPDDSNKWLKVAVAGLVMLAVWKLLYKDGVTGVRANDEPGLSALSIILCSILYWYLILCALFLIVLFAGARAPDWLPFGQSIDWGAALAIAALIFATVVYALGLRAAVRERRRTWD